jgi:hypothetical protein
VNHTALGNGTVVEEGTGFGGYPTLVIRFDRGGEKELLWEFSKEKLSKVEA